MAFLRISTRFSKILFSFSRNIRRGAKVRGHTRPQAARKQKALWKYFKKDYKLDSEGRVLRHSQKAQCLTCLAWLQTKDSTPAPLKKHLKSHHPALHDIWFAEHQADTAAFLEAKKEQANKDADGAFKFKVPSITKFLVATPYPANGQKQERFDVELTKAIVMCNLPFSLCDNTYFKELIHHLDPRITVKSRTTIAGRKLTILFHNVMEAVKVQLDKHLCKVGGLGLTTDTWQSRSNECYQSLTIHYIDPEFVVRR